jgi:hypothetical protein
VLARDVFMYHFAVEGPCRLLGPIMELKQTISFGSLMREPEG